MDVSTIITIIIIRFNYGYGMGRSDAAHAFSRKRWPKI